MWQIEAAMEPEEHPGGVERGVSAIDMDTPDFDRMESDLELAVERRQSMGSASGDASPRSVSSTGTSSSFAEDARYQHLHEVIFHRVSSRKSHTRVLCNAMAPPTHDRQRVSKFHIWEHSHTINTHIALRFPFL